MSSTVVLIIRDSRPGGGAEKQSLIFAQGLYENGWDVYLYTEKFSPEHLKKFAPDVKTLHNRKDIYSLGSRVTAISFLKNDHIFAWRLSWGKIKWIPFEWIHPDYYLNFGSQNFVIRKFKLFVLKFLHRSRSAALFVQTDTAKEAWKHDHGYSGPIYVIPNSYECPAKTVERDLKKMEFTVAFVGRLIPMKDPFLAISAFKIFLEKNMHGDVAVKLIVLGEGELRGQMQTYIDSLNLSCSVSLLGFRQDAGQLLANADLFIMTSYVEGMPNSLGEAMSFGLPCLVTDFPGGARELLGADPAQATQILSERNPEVFANRMNSFLKNSTIREELGQANRETIINNFNSKKILNTFIYSIEQVALK